MTILKTSQPYRQNDNTAVSTENVERVRAKNEKWAARGGRHYHDQSKRAGAEDLGNNNDVETDQVNSGEK